MSNELTADQLAAIAKVEKLLARAKGAGTTEGEAAFAAEKAQDLLLAFNLDMSIVESNGKGASAKREDTKMRGGLYKWQRDLWEAVAQLNFCFYRNIRGATKGSSFEHRIIGRTVNILSTKLMAEYLQDTVERLAREWTGNVATEYFRKETIAYREGITARVVERINAHRWNLEWEAKRKQKEEEARKSHPAYTGDTTNALTILDVKQSEYDANMDLLYGEGYSARVKANRASWEERQRLAMEAVAQWERDHPEEAAAKAAAEAAEAEKLRKKYERNAKRRKGTGSHYREWQPRHESFHDGYAKGEEVSLDQQINQEKRKRLA